MNKDNLIKWEIVIKWFIDLFRINFRYIIYHFIGWKDFISYDITNKECLIIYGMSHEKRGLWIYREKWVKL